MRIRVGLGGRHSSSRTASAAVPSYAMMVPSMPAPSVHVAPVVPGFARPTGIPNPQYAAAPHQVSPVHHVTPARGVAQIPDTDGRLARRVAHTAVDLVASAGTVDWASITVRVGIGFSEIDVIRADGSTVRCQGTSEKFSETRRELVQHLRRKHEIKSAAFTVAVSAANLDEVTLTLAS